MKTERDTLFLDEFEADMKGGFTDILNRKEIETLHYVQSELCNIQQSSWTSIDDDLFFPKDKVHKDGETVGIGRCMGTVQTSP